MHGAKVKFKSAIYNLQ